MHLLVSLGATPQTLEVRLSFGRVVVIGTDEAPALHRLLKAEWAHLESIGYDKTSGQPFRPEWGSAPEAPPRPKPCPVCHGKPKDYFSTYKAKCPACMGTGKPPTLLPTRSRALKPKPIIATSIEDLGL